MILSIVVRTDKYVPLTHHFVSQIEQSWRIELKFKSLNSMIVTLTIFIYNSWMSWTEHELFVDFANYFDYLHWNYSSFDAINKVVAPIA